MPKTSDKKFYHDWSVDQFAKHYADTLAKPANGLGQHVSDLFGQSHEIMRAATDCYPEKTVNAAFTKAMRVGERQKSQ